MTLSLKIPELETKKNQRVENAGVALVKEANERNEFFENKTAIYDEQVWTNKAKD